MQSEVAVTRLSSCECCVECIHRILEYAPMVLAYCGAVVRCVRHVYGDLHCEDLARAALSQMSTVLFLSPCSDV